MLKRRINRLLGITGYQFTRRPSLARDIASGRYRWMQNMGIKTVFDVGANTGQFATLIRQILPTSMIYSFEPLRECFRELSAKAEALSPIKCFNVALGSKGGVVDMQRNAFSPGSSLLPMTGRNRKIFPHTQEVTPERVTVRTLDEVCAGLKLSSGNFLKIDVQGYELNVLKGARKSLGFFDLIVVETSFVELYSNQSLFHDIYKFLHGRGFLYCGNFDQIHDPRSGATIQADAIFVNKRFDYQALVDKSYGV